MSDASPPRFRKDLIATVAQAEGLSFVDVRDPATGSTFRFYDFEYDLAMQLDGQPTDAIVAWAAARYGLDLTPEGIGVFATRLHEMGFLEKAPEPVQVDEVVFEFEDNPPVSEMVSRAVGQAAGGDVGATAGGSAAEPSTGLVVHQRDPAPVTLELGGPDVSLRGRATVRVMTAEPPASPAPSGSETLMGFASFTDKEASAIAAAVAATSPSSSSPTTQAPRAGERRQPPRPDSVEMAAFQPEEGVRSRPGGPPSHAGARGRARRDQRRRSMVALVTAVLIALVTGAAAVAGYYVWRRQQHAEGPESRRVRVMAPRPSAVYRWFDAVGAVVAGRARPVSFTSAGKVADALPAGSRYAAGEILARLQGAASHEVDVNRQRSRLAFYAQLRDSMKAAGNQSELRQAEIKLAQKQALVIEAEAALNRLVIRAAEPGEIVETKVARGAAVAADTPALLIKAGALRGEFPLAAADADEAAHLGFCRVQAAGPAPAGGAAEATPPAAAGDAARLADCKLAAPAAPGQRLAVELPASAGLAVGQPLRLARARYDAVFALPRSAVVRVGDTDRVYVATPEGIAEPRAVTLAAAATDEALVSRGIDVGDQVIIDPPADLGDGTRIEIDRGVAVDQSR